MEIPVMLGVIGLLLGLLGTVILAIALNKLTNELVLCLQLVDTTVAAIVGHGDIPRFTGIETRLSSGVESGKVRTIWGVIFIGLGFMLQLAALLLAVPCA